MRVAEPVPADDDLTALLRRFELPLLQYATRIFKGKATLVAVADWAQEGKSPDEDGYRAVFLRLVRAVQELKARM
jgi:hypothetical protein